MAETKPRRPRDLFQTVGVSGLVRYGVTGGSNVTGASGLIFEEWDPALQGQRGRQQYREMMDNDPIIGSFMFAIEMLIRNVKWHCQPRDDSDKAKEIAEYVEQCLGDMEISFTDTIIEILSMLPFGWSYHEMLFKRRTGKSEDPTKHSKYTDGKIGWRGFAIRGQETLYSWHYDEFDRVAGMLQLGPPDFVMHMIPIEKSLLFRTKTYKGNPEGRSILRNAWRPWKRKRHIEDIEGIGVERDLAGLPVAWVPINVLLGATDDDRETLTKIKQIVTNIRRDEQEGIVMPLAYDTNGKQVYDLKLMSTGGSRQFDTDKIVQRYDGRIASTVLADFILLGHEQTGTYALGGSKLGLFALAVGAWLDTIAAPFTDRAFPLLVELNNYDPALSPTLEHGEIEQADLAGMGSWLTTLNTLGLLPKDAKLIRHVLEMAELPVPDQDTLDTYVEQHDAQQEATTAEAQQRAKIARMPVSASPANAGKPPSIPVKRMGESIMGGEYAYGSTQVPLEAAQAATIRRWAHEVIDPDDLAPDGREDKPHVTVCFGLRQIDPPTVAIIRRIARAVGAVPLRFGALAMFPASESGSGDVLYVSVESPKLVELHEEIRHLTGAVQTHEGYTPHVTVAYLKPGRAVRYVGIVLPDLHDMVATRLQISDTEGQITEVPLGDTFAAVAANGHGGNV